MKVKTKSLTALALLALTLQAQATDVYIYYGGSYKPVGSMTDVYKVVTGPELTQVISTKGDTLTIENATFSYILLHKKAMAVEVEKLSAAQGLSVSYESGTVVVQAPERLKGVTVYAADGTAVARLTGKDADMVISTYGLPAGVYIVRAATVSGIKAEKKIIKR